MKKLLITAASLAIAIVPSAAAHAETSTDISGSDNTGYTTSYNSDSSSQNAAETYSSNTVKYEALYYVNYEASSVDWTKMMSSNNDSENSNEDYFSNMQGSFHNNMGGNGSMWGQSAQHKQ